MPIANTCSIGYPHDGRADNAAYRHDRRADNAAYRHDRRADSLSQGVIVLGLKINLLLSFSVRHHTNNDSFSLLELVSNWHVSSSQLFCEVNRENIIRNKTQETA